MMRKILLSAVLALILTTGFADQAKAVNSGFDDAVGGGAAVIGVADAATASGAVWLGSTITFVGNGLVAPVALSYLVGNQVDPWHPIACAIFGDSARVGNETSAHCD